MLKQKGVGERCSLRKVKGFLLSIGVAIVAGMILLTIAALVIGKTGNLPQGVAVPVLVTVLLCVAVFLGGLAASLLTGEKGLLLGGACGLFISCCILAGGLLHSQGAIALGGAGRLAAIFFSGCIGGILGVNRKRKVKF
jgi:putative membrane protein (TIGR04086 family)